MLGPGSKYENCVISNTIPCATQHERNPIRTSPFSHIQFITPIYWRKRRLRTRRILSDTRTIGIIRCFGRFI